MRRALGSVPLAAVLLNVTAVAVLLPDIRLDLGSSSSGGQWVLNAYLVALAALLPLFRRLRADDRLLIAAGALAMAAGAVACATADTTGLVVAGQAAEGAGAAALLARVAAPWSDGLSRAAVALPAVALALGPLVGGVFAELNWWRIFFWAGVPVAAATAACALAGPRPERAPFDGDALRLPAFAAGVTALTIALVQGEIWAWGWSTLLLFFGAAFLGRARLHELPVGALAWATLGGCLAALLFLVPEYFQLGRNLSGLRSGALLLAVTFAAVAAWTLSAWLAGSFSLAVRGLLGVACLALGLAILVMIGPDTRYALLIVALGMTGAGLGVTAAAVPGVPALGTEYRPLNAAFAGAALGLAGAGAAFQAAQSDERASGASFEQALAAGVGWAAGFLLVVLAIAALLIWRMRAPAQARS